MKLNMIIYNLKKLKKNQMLSLDFHVVLETCSNKACTWLYNRYGEIDQSAVQIRCSTAA